MVRVEMVIVIIKSRQVCFILIVAKTTMEQDLSKLINNKYMVDNN